MVKKIARIVLRARLHQALASRIKQLCNDACDTILIENNGVTPEWDFQTTPLISIRTV